MTDNECKAKERPILFSAPMVQAILDGRKTITRRIVNKYRWHYANGKKSDVRDIYHNGEIDDWEMECMLPSCPYGSAGDKLWVRETWMQTVDNDTLKPTGKVLYRAGYDGINPIMVDGDGFQVLRKDGTEASAWKPSIFMPRWASRITLEICSVRMERLGDISEEDAIAEGMKFTDYKQNRWGNPANGWSWRESASTDQCLYTARFAFANLWNHINGPDAWDRDKDKWVWVIEFRRIEK